MPFVPPSPDATMFLFHRKDIVGAADAGTALWAGTTSV